MRDGKLPEDIDGLILSGGYPELYAAQLEKNETMRRSVRHAAEEGMPLLAECGGFIYLHQAVEGADGGGKMYRMAGVIPETCCRGKRLDQFGYISLTPRKSGMAAAPGDTLKAHEFHYWKSTDPGKDFTSKKQTGAAIGNVDIPRKRCMRDFLISFCTPARRQQPVCDTLSGIPAETKRF